MVEHATYPQWVLDMIETEFYEPCGNHSATEKTKYCNFFCMDCPRSPFCDLCYSHKVHDGHRVIQASDPPPVAVDLYNLFLITSYDHRFNCLLFLFRFTNLHTVQESKYLI